MTATEHAAQPTNGGRPQRGKPAPQAPPDPILESRRYRFLAWVFHTLAAAYFGLQIARGVDDAAHAKLAGKTPIGAFVDALLNNPLLTLAVCGGIGAVVAQVFRRDGPSFSVYKSTCFIYAGAIAGLLAPQITVIGGGSLATTGPHVVALIAGYAGEKSFDWLSKRIIK